MKSLHTLRIGALAAALFLSVSAIHAGDAPTLPVKPVLSNAFTTAASKAKFAQAYDGFIVTYKEGTTEHSNRDAALQNVTVALGRTGLNRATVSSTGTKMQAVSASYQRKLAVGSDLIRTSRQLNKSEAAAFMKQLAADPAVAHVQPNFRRYVIADMQRSAPPPQAQIQSAQPQTSTPNDPLYSEYQWNFFNPVGGANINNAWDIADGTGVTVAVLDNDADDARYYSPGGCPGVVTVASNGIAGHRAFYSNFGSAVTLSAPAGSLCPDDSLPNQNGICSDGTDIRTYNFGWVWSTLNSGETTPDKPVYAGYIGTSQATPHVAGTVAMIIGATKAAGLATPSPAEIKTLLTKSARPFPVAQDHVIGTGIVDAAAAVKLAVEGDTGNPGDGNDPGTTLTKGMILSGQNIGAGAAVRYSVTVPAGATTLNIRTIGGIGGDISLYVKAGSSPAANGSDADFRSVKPGNNEAVVIQQPQATTYYILVVGGESATSNLSVLADYKQP